MPNCPTLQPDGDWGAPHPHHENIEVSDYFQITETDNLTASHKYNIEEFVCGWGAAFVNIAATFPMNKVMFRQQLHGITCYKAATQLRREGFLNLYRGILPPLMQKTVSVSLMLGLYDYYNKAISWNYPTLSKPVTQGLAAMMAGSTEAILTPFERVQTVLQDHRHMKKFHNTLHVFQELRPYGIKEYYRGLTPILLRNGPSNVLFFGLRGPFKSMLPEANSQVRHTVNDFLSGAMVGALISTLFFPINVVKTRMQVRVGGPRYPTLKTFRIIWRERGHSVRHMFLGVHINFTRSLVSWGIINASYELIKTMLPQLS